MKLNLPEKLHGLKEEEIRLLYKEAVSVMKNAYAPYSKFNVGAALLSSTGEIFTGVNVENGSYGATMCAERVAVFKSVSEGVNSIRALLITADFDTPIPPCGMCRQVISEFPGNKIIISTNTDGLCDICSFESIFPTPFTFKP